MFSFLSLPFAITAVITSEIMASGLRKKERGRASGKKGESQTQSFKGYTVKTKPVIKKASEKIAFVSENILDNFSFMDLP